MANHDRTLLIVDDSEIDREILKNILYGDFEILEAENGFTAIEIISSQKNNIDAILLDISMPLISGFDVLRLLKDNHLNNIPVFLITAEATKDNVVKAAEFGIAEFISKPFDREDILRRMKSQLGVVTKYWLTVEDVMQTSQYISALESIYKTYLFNFGKEESHYLNMVELMKILLNKYSPKHKDADLNREKIEIISRAAYFCDIGLMLVPDKLTVFARDPEKIKTITQNHTKFGADIIKLESSKSCSFFIDTCSEMCLNHHERYDGYGYPRGLAGKNISIYSQMCRLVDEFDGVFSKLYGANEMQVTMVMKKILSDDGLVSPELLSLLDDCKPNITNYYMKRRKEEV